MLNVRESPKFPRPAGNMDRDFEEYDGDVRF